MTEGREPGFKEQETGDLETNTALIPEERARDGKEGTMFPRYKAQKVREAPV